MFASRAAKCLSLHSQIVKGCLNYAMEHQRLYPPRFVAADGTNTDDHPWYWSTADGSLETRAVAETYFGAPEGVTCPISDLEFKWREDRETYAEPTRSNICVYAGWQMGTSSNVDEVFYPAAPDTPDMDKAFARIPTRLGDHSSAVPLTGDFLTDRTNDDKGWWTCHSRDRTHHDSQLAADPPTDPIPFGYADGRVLRTVRFTALYRTEGEGTRYWAER